MFIFLQVRITLVFLTHLMRLNTKSEVHYRMRCIIIPSKLQAQFLQVNRAEAVHLPFIQEITGDEIRTAHRSFYISEAFYKDVKKKLNILS